MRALVGVAMALALAGCGATTDPCKDIAGTCVSLTVQSSTVATVDSLHILASGALTGDQTSAGGRANLPVVVALKLPANTMGSLDLHVDAFLTAQLVGSCDTDTLVTPGKHATAVCTLLNADNGSVDMTMPADGGSDGGTPPDMVTIACDPKGMTGPQCQWRWQTPLPTGDQIDGLFAFSDTNIFGLTHSGAIIHRDAMGWSMLPNMPTPAAGLYSPRKMSGSASILTGNHLYVMGLYSASGSPTAVFHSTDQAGTWTEEMTPALTSGDFASNIANDGNAAIVVSFEGEIVTRNSSSGMWTVQQIGAGNSTSFSGAYMGTTVWLALGNDNMGGLIASAPSGTTTWTEHRSLGPVGTQFSGACGAPAGGSFRYWAVGSQGINTGIIYTSTDGSTWTGQTSNANQILYGCVASDANNAWAWGQKGIVVHTSNAGTTWATETSGADPNGFLQTGTLSPQGSITLGGNNGTLIRTMNGGATWISEQTGTTAGFQAIAQVAPNTLYAAGSDGTIARTTDGTSWTKLTSPTTNPLIAVWGSSANDVYVVGGSGTVLHSTDGTTFTKYTNPASGGIPATATVTDVAGLGTSNVFAATSTGLYHSTDGGTTWGPVTVTGLTGTSVNAVFAMGADIWIGASAGQVFHSVDGVSWTAQPIPGPIGNQDVTRIRGRAPKVLYVAYGSAGLISRSNDGGATWTVLAPATGTPLGDGVYDVAPTPTGDYLYASATSGLVVSQDDGVNWAPVQMKVALSQTAGLAVLANNNIYATTNGTGIVHYGN